MSAKFDRVLHPEFGIVGGRCSYSGLSPSASNCRLHSVGGSDADAAGQATFYRCFDKIVREEGERDGHIDMPNATN